MSESNSYGQNQSSPGAVSSFLTPPVCAVAAFALAVLAMFGQNAMTVGVSTVVQGLVRDVGVIGGPDGFYLGFGVAVILQVLIVHLLARRALEATGGWEAHLGRAAVIVGLVALAAAALVIVGGVLFEGSPY